MDMNSDHCRWCDIDISLNDLVGVNSNQCPVCGNPVTPVKFGDMRAGRVFVDASEGGMWVKIDAEYAVCVDDDSAFRIGQEVAFNQSDVLYQY